MRKKTTKLSIFLVAIELTICMVIPVLASGLYTKEVYAASDEVALFGDKTQDEILAAYEKYLGRPYVWGGKTPDGWDCSGYVAWVAEHELGHDITTGDVDWTGTLLSYARNHATLVCEGEGKGETLSNALKAWNDGVASGTIQPGDEVMFFFTKERQTHVGIVHRNGNVIHAWDESVGTLITTFEEVYKTAMGDPEHMKGPYIRFEVFRGAGITNGEATLVKKSADTSVSDNDSDYSLAGAKYVVYTDKACTKQAKTTDNKNAQFTTDKDGKTDTIKLNVGTYYVKETVAAKNFKLDDTVYTLKLESGDEKTLTVKDQPYIYGGVKVKKVDAETKGKAQGDASLAGAQYTIADSSGKDVKTITTGEDGIATTGNKDLIEGIYTIRETKAPAGYHLNTTWKKTFTISKHKVVIDLTADATPEQIVRGGVKIQKTDADLKKAQAQGNATLEGAVFAITNKSKEAVIIDGKQYTVGAVVKTISTNKDGVAQTAANALPYGTYEIAEKDPSAGYLLNNSWKQAFTIREEGKIVDLTGKTCEEPVIRGGVRVKKQDNDYKDEIAQGDATLAGAEFTISNKSKASVVVGGKKYKTGEDVLTITTNAEGYAESAKDALPHGTYEIRETKPSTGYLLNEDWKQTFTIRENDKIVDLIEEPCDEKVIRGGVAIEKRDRELDLNEALGGAWLSGIEFTIINSSNLRVFVDEKSFEPDETVATIVPDEEGRASLPASTLPYGTYTIQETATNESYLLTDGEPRTFEIRDDGETVTVSTDGEELNFRNQVVRNDFHLNKIADGSNARMGQVAFKLEMVTTGETHVIVTDRNGVYNSQSRDYKHSQDTNANDFVLEKHSGEDDVIPTAELNYKAGLWFGLGHKGSQAEIDDALGALPYGEYRLTELRCEANEGYKLLEITFYLEKDFTNGAIIDLGTMTDDEEPKPEIGTTALAKDTGTHETQAAKETTIIDTVAFKNLKPDTEYTMHGKLILVNKDGTTEEILYNGNPVTAEKTFTPKEPDGQIEMEFTFDSSALGGKKTVVFEELRKGSVVVAEHADPKDEGQTVRITEPEPTPTPTEEPTPEPEKPTVTPTPITTVAPSNPTTPSSPTTPSTPTTTSTGKGTTTIQAVPVKTGDNSRIGLYLILMIVAGGAGVLTAKFRKKK